ncbi:hypothetical protein COW94_04395 [Candidatus Peregrinibacteria bacterium CG22_combo_CG10-13_8_21_14_all_44_10]|nr:MAG: hypothetical protein AUK45_01175 [Candidatus Peregrinibacteria bacterium CG2_30_44_17]PIP65943.1 MAG: hypothetical protein COW94_04395 [Candidatus Peregrinibacteria bacterium CG22_combo_CG10-13_8_21_14_all_44_10]PIS04158.1 MAG: hypothetical protein COT83_02120 [Candidatus Peregrinibacteria bacterium CG10_big_fil_rev_8_21_14_0_10_44_7]PIX79830.1 MAG: hypothetical protein COZ35_02495 [Candidatus Peregrinibacteria bacterium CG_4_10_14_3_um_filter_44_21]PJB89150.1 MAG: hypothetical protein 
MPVALAKKMADLSLKMPIAFGTGRIMEHLQGHIEQILRFSKDPETTKKNWYIIGENGGAGHWYNPDSKSYEEFYRVDWDSSLIDRQKLKALISKEAKQLIESISINQTQFLIRPYREGVPIGQVAKNTAKIKEIADTIMRSYKGHNEFEVLDSSIAVHINPKTANKDLGVRMYAKLLSAKLGIQSGESARDIMVIGDQAGPGRNDYEFLKGDIGTPFTVGDLDHVAEWPLPVFDGDNVIKGPEGTLYLIEKAKFGLR